jgi:hypothetical protein
VTEILLVAFIMLAVGYVILLRAYYHTRAKLADLYDDSANVIEHFTGTLQVGEQALAATSAYGAYMQELAYQLANQTQDPERRKKLLEGMSGARMQYLAMHPFGDTTDPDAYLFTNDEQPPPLLEI